MAGRRCPGIPWLLFLLSLTLAGPVLAAEDPVRFGVIADPQYAPVPPRGSRYYGNTLWKLSEAVTALNSEPLDFVVTLGDMIDRHVDSFTHILPVYQRLQHDNYFVLGNHEFAVADDYKLTVPALLGMQQRYYDFCGTGATLCGHRWQRPQFGGAPGR